MSGVFESVLALELSNSVDPVPGHLGNDSLHRRSGDGRLPSNCKYRKAHQVDREHARRLNHLRS